MTKNWWLLTVVLKTLESPFDGKEIQPVNPKGNHSWIFLEGLMVKLKLQYFDHLTQRTDSLENTLMRGKTEDRRRRGRQTMRWLDGITAAMGIIWVGFGYWWWTGKPAVVQSTRSQRVRHDWANEQLYWTELWYIIFTYIYSHTYLVNLEISSVQSLSRVQI